MKNDASIIVGHLPQKISQQSSIFLTGGGTITATVTGPRKYSSDLAQGGLEISCDLKYCGNRFLKIKKGFTSKETITTSKETIALVV